MNKFFIFLLSCSLLAGCASQPNYIYEAQENDAKIKFSSDFDSYTFFYLQHQGLPYKRLASFLQTSIIKDATTKEEVVYVPKNTALILEAQYANKDLASIYSATRTCGPLKTILITKPNQTYLVRMNKTNHNEGKGFFDKKVDEQCFLTIIDEKTQKSVLLKK
ncbi:hypothetical protein [Ignatzschineria sp. LJL83]